MTELRYEVLVNDGVRRHRTQRLPDGSPIVSSPPASTLIFGDHDAVLVDVPFTRNQVARVGDWVESFGKRLARGHLRHLRNHGQRAPARPGAQHHDIPTARTQLQTRSDRVGLRGLHRLRRLRGGLPERVGQSVHRRQTRPPVAAAAWATGTRAPGPVDGRAGRRKNSGIARCSANAHKYVRQKSRSPPSLR